MNLTRHIDLLVSSLGFALANLNQFNDSIGLSEVEGAESVTRREIEAAIGALAAESFQENS